MCIIRDPAGCNSYQGRIPYTPRRLGGVKHFLTEKQVGLMNTLCCCVHCPGSHSFCLRLFLSILLNIWLLNCVALSFVFSSCHPSVYSRFVRTAQQTIRDRVLVSPLVLFSLGCLTFLSLLPFGLVATVSSPSLVRFGFGGRHPDTGTEKRVGPP